MTDRVIHERMKFSKLALVSLRPGTYSDPASISIPPADGTIVVPTFIRAVSQFPSTGIISAAILDACAARYLYIERCDSTGTAMTSYATPLDYRSPTERGLQQPLEVEGLQDVATLAGTTLRLRFDGALPGSEWQYLLVQYKRVKPTPDRDGG